MTNQGIDRLLEVLALEARGDDFFIGPASGEPHVRAFGGHVAAQAFMAAGLTVAPGRPANSLSARFIRPGDSSEPIEYRVENIFDGRSFSYRTVKALQHGRVILDLDASFHIREKGVEHSVTMPDVPPPESLQTFEERFRGRENDSDMARWFFRGAGIDLRYTNHTPFEPVPPTEHAVQRVWMKTQPLPDDPLIHRAVVTYASDMTLLDSVLLKHGQQWTEKDILGASLSHHVFFQRDPVADEWLLFDQWSPSASGAMGLAMANVWSSNGQLVASVVQDALLRETSVEIPGRTMGQ